MLDGRETAEVAAGTFDTFRVRMNVDERRTIGKLALPTSQGYDVARNVVAQMRPPDTRMWLTTSAPHVVVRTFTVPGPPGTSPCTIEPATLDAQIPRLATSLGE
ncbi:MAG: hypothetical protein FJ148_10865 [Deltaproteobacteria bacterium]|nr:hypothetical protein [Deltaproteobacteria bacterium]